MCLYFSFFDDNFGLFFFSFKTNARYCYCYSSFVAFFVFFLHQKPYHTQIQSERDSKVNTEVIFGDASIINRRCINFEYEHWIFRHESHTQIEESEKEGKIKQNHEQLCVRVCVSAHGAPAAVTIVRHSKYVKFDTEKYTVHLLDDR